MTTILTILPNSQAPFVGQDGRCTREAYYFFRNLQNYLQQQINGLIGVSADLTALQELVDSIVAGNVVYYGSITGTGTDIDPVRLVNDDPSPVAFVSYGTDADATKGFQVRARFLRKLSALRVI